MLEIYINDSVCKSSKIVRVDRMPDLVTISVVTDCGSTVYIKYQHEQICKGAYEAIVESLNQKNDAKG